MILDLKFEGGVVGILYARGLEATRHEFVDLRVVPEAIDDLPEPKRWPELGQFLTAVNEPTGSFLTLGCECEGSDDGTYPGGMTNKITSYTQVAFADLEIARAENAYFVLFGRLHKAMKDRSRAEPLMVDVAVEQFEFVESGKGGWCVCIWVNGFGMDATQARAIWSEGLTAIAAFFQEQSRNGGWFTAERVDSVR